MNNDKLQIKLNILGTDFKLYIERSEEAYYRRAEREINKIHTKYCSKYSSVKDFNKLSGMTLLHFAVNLLYERDQSNDISESLTDLGNLIEQYTNKE
ncbi:MAG: cell division protein ZapA [Paludibacteraceae bacterium]|nr:cell division protein ZapA [Paludibacteraceae bacterium]